MKPRPTSLSRCGLGAESAGLQRARPRLIFQGDRPLLQVAGARLDGCTATVVIWANQGAVLIAHCGRAINLGTAGAVPEAVRGEDGVVLLTGILYRTDCRLAVNGADFSGKQLPRLGKCGSQRGTATGSCG